MILTPEIKNFIQLCSEFDDISYIVTDLKNILFSTFDNELNNGNERFNIEYNDFLINYCSTYYYNDNHLVFQNDELIKISDKIRFCYNTQIISSIIIDEQICGTIICLCNHDYVTEDIISTQNKICEITRKLILGNSQEKFKADKFKDLLSSLENFKTNPFDTEHIEAITTLLEPNLLLLEKDTNYKELYSSYFDNLNILEKNIDDDSKERLMDITKSFQESKDYEMALAFYLGIKFDRNMKRFDNHV